MKYRKMIAKYNLLLLLLSFLSGTIQPQIKISGRVTDLNNRPLSFVSVVLLQDSSFIFGASTDEMGNFQLSSDNEQHKRYSIKISLVGYQSLEKNFIYPDTNFFKQIVLTENKNTLSSVTVTAKKPLIVRKADRYIINVESSFLANGNSGLEVLQKLPGIWVGNDGSIRIKGNQPVMVMINDIVQRMSGEELAEYLKALRSEDISKIEVIQNPPSEFEAAGSGGIIHIILKRSRQDGLNGSANGNYRRQEKSPLTSMGFSLNYKIKNIYLFGSYSFTKDFRSIVETAGIIYPDKSFYTNNTDRKENITYHQYRLGMAYDLAANHNVIIQTIRTHSELLQNFITGLQYTTDSQSTTGILEAGKLRNFRYGSTTLNYSWKIDTIGSMLKIIADYTNNNKTEDNDFLEVYSDPLQNSTYRNSMPFYTDNYSVQADYIKVFKNKTEWKSGSRYSSIKRDNIIASEDYNGNNWAIDPAGSNRFIYTENLLMFYSSVEKTIKKLTVKAGLRAEETYSIGNSVNSGQEFYKKYFGLFPSVFIMRTLNEQKENSVYMSYARRLTRPGLRDLNPYRLLFNNYTALQGNPDLLPQYIHNFVVGYKFLNDYSVDVYITKTKNVITLSANPGNGNFIDYHSENVSSSNEYGVDLSAPFTFFKIWSVNSSFSLFHLSYSFNDQKISQTTFSAKAVHTITIKKFIDIDIVADYRSPYTYSNLYNPYTFYMDAGFSKKILKSRGRLRLYFTDIFNTLREKELTDYDNTHIEFYRKRPTQSVGFSFSYSFSSGKQFSNRRIDQSNNEERNRIGN